MDDPQFWLYGIGLVLNLWISIPRVHKAYLYVRRLLRPKKG